MNSQPTLTSSDSVSVVVLPVNEEARRTPAAVRGGDKIVASSGELSIANEQDLVRQIVDRQRERTRIRASLGPVI